MGKMLSVMATTRTIGTLGTIVIVMVVLFGCGTPRPIPSPFPSPSPPPAEQPYDCDRPPALAGVIVVSEPVPGYIVVLKHADPAPSGAKTAAIEARTVQSLSARYSLQDVQHFRAVSSFAAAMDASTAQRLAADQTVQYVQQNGAKRIRETAKSWGQERVHERDLSLGGQYDQADFGAGIGIIVNDTGGSPGHAEFTGRFGECKSAIAGQGCEDGHGHATHVAGTALGSGFGIAKKATLYTCRSLDSRGSGTDADVLECVNWGIELADRFPDRRFVQNESLGGGPSPALDAGICRAIARGVQHSLAAGNETADARGGSPSRVLQALTVGASDRFDRVADFSNYGPVVDLHAPGVDIVSIGGAMSGTSMAAPHGVGVMAIALGRHPGWTSAQLLDWMTAHATPGKLGGLRSGTPNLLAYAKE